MNDSEYSNGNPARGSGEHDEGVYEPSIPPPTWGASPTSIDQRDDRTNQVESGNDSVSRKQRRGTRRVGNVSTREGGSDQTTISPSSFASQQEEKASGGGNSRTDEQPTKRRRIEESPRGLYGPERLNRLGSPDDLQMKKIGDQLKKERTTVSSLKGRVAVLEQTLDEVSQQIVSQSVSFKTTSPEFDAKKPDDNPIKDPPSPPPDTFGSNVASFISMLAVAALGTVASLMAKAIIARAESRYQQGKKRVNEPITPPPLPALSISATSNPPAPSPSSLLSSEHYYS